MTAHDEYRSGPSGRGGVPAAGGGAQGDRHAQSHKEVTNP
jgi:hypothetical protein